MLQRHEVLIAKQQQQIEELLGALQKVKDDGNTVKHSNNRANRACWHCNSPNQFKRDCPVLKMKAEQLH